MQFDWGHDLDIIRMQVSEKVDQIKPALPEQIGEVLIYSFNTSDIPVVQAPHLGRGRRHVGELPAARGAGAEPHPPACPGVAKVELDGVEPREIFIELILDKVKEHGVDVGELIRLLRGASANLVLGEVEDGGLRYTARALGSFQERPGVPCLAFSTMASVSGCSLSNAD